MKKLKRMFYKFIGVIILLCLLTLTISPSVAMAAEIVTFPDPGLEAVIREAIKKPEGDIYSSDLDVLTYLYASIRNIADLTGLEYCTNLIHLDLGGNQISDILPLSGLTNLTWLSLAQNQIHDITSLQNLTNLTTLYLVVNQIIDISPLSKLTNLWYLDSGQNQISDISILSDLTNLTQLHINSNQINDISPISSLTSLTSLGLGINKISDILPLSGLTNLTSLTLAQNQISNILPLSNLTSLWYLDIGYNQISDISILSGLTNLTQLYITRNHLTNISPLSNLTSLLDLDIGQNQISDISKLSGLTNLTMLHLGGNQISDISSLSNLTSLWYLDIGYNQISDIFILSGLTNLTQLYITSNQLTDISRLSNLTNLIALKLDGNDISDISSLSNLTSLIELDLDSNNISDISSLVQNEGLDEGDWVDLRGNPLSYVSLYDYIPQLEIRVVTVFYDIPPNQPPVADGGGPYEGSEGGEILFDASGSTDPDNNIVLYEWDLNNDGHTDATGISAEATFYDNGSHTVGLRVTDQFGKSDTDTADVTVSNVAPTVDVPIVTPEHSEEGEEVIASATFADPGVDDAPTCTVDYGDGSGNLSGDVSDGTCIGPEHIYKDNGTYSVTISVTDKDGGTGDSSATHQVGNLCPVIGEISAPIDPVEVNAPIQVAADFFDPGVLDTHTALWTWGDDLSSPGDVNEVDGSGSVTGEHAYAAAGVYTIQLAVTDKDGCTTEEIYQYVVVYDTDGGFVTGGGWIDSPEGAYTSDPTLAGKAIFGFTSKYLSGTDIPTGNTRFKFNVAHFTFTSDTYDWLVIAGAKVKFKGIGEVNGESGYKFMLTAIDADINENDSHDVDKFRIKIWYENESGEEIVVYDNQPGGTDVSDAETEIGGGSIKIHKAK